MMKPVLSLMIAGSLLAGCATRTPYQRPAAPLPAAFTHQDSSAQATVRDDIWWRAFGDPALDGLLDLAIIRNPDLAAAAVRVRRAQLEAQLAGNALLPAPNGSLSTGLLQPLSGRPRGSTETASGSVGLAWEVDLFGRLDARRDAARFEAEATAEDRAGVLLILVGTTASLYWQIALANERITLAEESLAYARRTQSLVEAQYKAGGVSALEVREAEQTVTAQEAALSEVRQARVRAREALTVLLNGAPGLTDEPQSLSTKPLPNIAAGLPADLLGRRPDLRAAELRLRAVLASADAAKASFYPALILTGALGTSSSGLLNLLTNPVATLGAGLTLPFLNLNAMHFETQIARTRYEEAVILFRKSLYSALAEVETALSARAELATQGFALRRARDAAADAERLYEIRYRAGSVPLRTWLDAQERRRAADLALSSNKLTQLQNQVTLHQALGGGFEK
ncbi:MULTISPECIES: efflux transporter outer membrane subunit [unclassified Sphingobium]|uniref:efflux transporter outer membrane subunit n=1 Tax=unclassified Sphingobium TaxID=2611147 RepID=UPI0022251161|nr:MULTISPECIES: efflux transporter outer membrane subunit [unclassified Sphingobium]MCW2395759.1 NodT family efflux transporter outer membrane factor (OMF) lipoprotein [Sphingobium sp. B8D3B]MCW2419274.1 NodT family efflux transporter outer membrane factor (OMF) lipoprotein [Sphingobium sp. B8D3C]